MSHKANDILNESIEETLDRQTAHIRALQEEVDALRPVAEAAVEWCQAVQFAHHNPTKKGYLKAVLARLNTEVEEFTVWEMG